MPTDTDRAADLLEASVSDPEAFGQLYDQHVHAVLAFFYRRTADAGLAADLTAETFAQAFASRSSYRRMSVPAEAWILGIARNQLRRALRRGRASTKAQRRIGLERLEVDDVSLERIEELVDLQPMREAIQQALGELGPATAEALRLRIDLEMSYQEVARRLGCSERAARVRVSRGLRRLQRFLEVGT